MYLGPQQVIEALKPVVKAILLGFLGVFCALAGMATDSDRARVVLWCCAMPLLVGSGIWLSRWRRSGL